MPEARKSPAQGALSHLWVISDDLFHDLDTGLQMLQCEGLTSRANGRQEVASGVPLQNQVKPGWRQMLSPPCLDDARDPKAGCLFWSRVHNAADARCLSRDNATLLLYYAVGGAVTPGKACVVERLGDGAARVPAPLPTVAALLAAGANPRAHPHADDSYEGMLDAAARVADGPLAAGLCRALLAAGATVADRAPTRASTLSIATTAEAMLALLEAGADASADANWPYASMLLHPAAQGSAALCRALLAAGACPSVQIPQGVLPLTQRVPQLGTGQQPIHGAACLEMVHTLLDAGVDVRALNTARDTALTCPAALQSAEACRVLLAHGADPDAFAAGASSPLELAGTPAVAALLLDACSGTCALSREQFQAVASRALFAPAARRYAETRGCRRPHP